MLLAELHHAFMSGGANVGVLTSMVAELAAEDPLTLSTSPHVSLLLDHVAAVVTTRGGCSGTSGSGGSASGGDSTDGGQTGHQASTATAVIREKC